MTDLFTLMYLLIRYEIIWKRYVIVHYTNHIWPKIMRFYYGLVDKSKRHDKIANIFYKLGHRWFNMSCHRFQHEQELIRLVDTARKELLNFSRYLNNT